jgi:hypothetical protein
MDCFAPAPVYRVPKGGNMRQSEVKRVKPDPKKNIQRDPSMNAQNHGEEKDATEPTPLNKEVPIIQRYSE